MHFCFCFFTKSKGIKKKNFFLQGYFEKTTVVDLKKEARDMLVLNVALQLAEDMQERLDVPGKGIKRGVSISQRAFESPLERRRLVEMLLHTALQ